MIFIWLPRHNVANIRHPDDLYPSKNPVTATFERIRSVTADESASILARFLAVDRPPCAINPFRKLQGIPQAPGQAPGH